MLRSEHAIVHFDFRRMIAKPDRLTRRQDAAYLDAGERIVALYREGIGRCRQELHRGVEAVTATLEDCPPRRTAAFCKLMDDRAEYHANQEAANLRKRTFQHAASWHPIVEQRQGIFEHELQAARGQLEVELRLPWQQIESSLFADVIELQVLQSFPQEIDAETLLSAYNVAQTQAVLYRMIEARLRVTRQVKTIVRQIKLAGLMHRIERLEGSPPQYKIRLDGAQSSLRETTRYGVRLARVIPTLLQCGGWQLEARVRGPKGQSFRATLSPDDGLRSEHPKPNCFDSALEQEIDAAWQRDPVESWSWEHESELLCIGQSVLTPDFALRHQDGSLVIHVEVVGYWTPEYLAEKRMRLQQFLNDPNHTDRRWLMILSEKLRPEFHEAISSLRLPLLVWKKNIPPRTWIDVALTQNSGLR